MAKTLKATFTPVQRRLSPCPAQGVAPNQTGRTAREYFEAGVNGLKSTNIDVYETGLADVKEAAAHNYPPAHILMGDLYLAGKVTPRDDDALDEYHKYAATESYCAALAHGAEEAVTPLEWLRENYTDSLRVAKEDYSLIGRHNVMQYQWQIEKIDAALAQYVLDQMVSHDAQGFDITESDLCPA